MILHVLLKLAPALSDFAEQDVGAEELHLRIHATTDQLDALPRLRRSSKLCQPGVRSLSLCCILAVQSLDSVLNAGDRTHAEV